MGYAHFNAREPRIVSIRRRQENGAPKPYNVRTRIAVESNGPIKVSDESPAPDIGDSAPHSVIYLLRTMHQYHAQMTALADQKASLLIGASLVIFTVTLAQWRTGAMTAALVVLGVTAVIAALLAMVAVVPSFRWKTRGEAEPNPLFFGSFAEMTEQQYLERMEEVIRDEHSVYSAMMRDIYHLGWVLYRRKYRFLSYSYRVFAVGLAAALATAAYTWLLTG